jgi:carbonic anhydrase/acetyltransferase-like protein (isoleucine patch superfamily)
LVHETVYLAQGAIVLGDVTLEEEVSIWFNAVLRGDCAPIRIGPRTNIQDGCIVHADPGFPCTVGAGVTVGHGAIIHGATIGDGALVGMKSVVQNGAHVGDGAIIATGAVVPEGMQIPPRCVVMGVPGKIRREATEEEFARSALGAAHYVENARVFAAAAKAAAAQ